MIAHMLKASKTEYTGVCSIKPIISIVVNISSIQKEVFITIVLLQYSIDLLEIRCTMGPPKKEKRHCGVHSRRDTCNGSAHARHSPVLLFAALVLF